ncbi:hypothetical protein OXX69_002434 [Metschnikowia pulcherrima]
MFEELKKSRITTACDYCRSKRAKCDGKAPTCTNCQRNEINCTYSKKTKKRGLPTGYISNLEAQVNAYQHLMGYLVTPEANGGAGLLPVIRSALECSHNILKPNRELDSAWSNSPVHERFALFVSLQKSDVEKSRSAPKSFPNEPEQVSSNVRESSTAHQILSPSQSTIFSLPRSIEGPSASLTTPATLDEFAFVDVDYESLLTNDIFHFTPEDIEPPQDKPPVALQYHGISQLMSGFSSSSILKYNSVLGTGEKNPFRVGTIFNISSSSMAQRFKQAGQVRVPLEIYRFPQDIRKMVEAYFHIYHPWMPMLDRFQVIRHVARLQDNTKPPSNLQLCSVISLIWSILALERVDDDPTLAFGFARNAILALECAPVTTMESIQSMILLGIFFYKAGDWDNAWVLISSSSRMAIDVRLMRPSARMNDKFPHDAQTNYDNTTRERTWATIYSINTLLAARMGRSPLVRATDWPTPVINDEGWEEWESWKSFGDGETFVIESGRCLSIFNELLKIITLLNRALTCNIDSMNTSDTALNFTESGSMLLYSFQKDMGDWMANLPPHCELFNNKSPMVSHLHMCSNMVWCILCVRLLHMRDTLMLSSKGVIETRNSEYTTACISNRRILDQKASSMMLKYPFVDYFILMSLNFPGMLSLNPLDSANHTSAVAQMLESFSRFSISCRITWDLYRIENGMDVTEKWCGEDMNGSSTHSASFQRQQQQQKQQPEHYALEQSSKPDIKEASAPPSSNNANFSSLPRFEYNNRQQKFSSYNQNAPKEELDLFMLDTDFAKSDNRLDKFMKNLGFVSKDMGNLERNTSAQSLLSLSNLSMPIPEPNTDTVKGIGNDEEHN